MNLSSTRVGGLAGLGFVLVVVTVNLVLGSAGQPRAGASPEEVQTYFAGSPVAVDVASALAPLAWICLPLFAGGVLAATRARSAERSDAWPWIGLGAVFMQNAVFTGVAATQIALDAGGLSPEVTWGLWQLHNALFVLNLAGLSIIMLALTVAGVRTGLVARPHAVVGGVAATLTAAAAVTTSAGLAGGPVELVGLAGFLLWLGWLTTYAVVLLRASRPVAVAATAPVERVAQPA